MFKRIKRYFLNREIKRRGARKSVFRSWSEIRTVLVLFESDVQEKNSGARAFIKSLQAEGKRVLTCCYVDRKRAETATLDSFVVLDHSTLTWTGKPQNIAIAERIKDEFDVLIDLTENDCLPLQYVMTMAKCSFRCGRNRGEGKNGEYDFVIEMPEHPVEPKTGLPVLDYDFEGILGGQIVKYLKIVNS